MPLLLAACPGFEPTWNEHLAWWKGAERGSYNDVAELARYLVESYNRGETSEFPAAFSTVEKILNEGDEAARGLAAVGVLEDVQTIASHSCGPYAFVPWLGATSRDVWAQIERFWADNHSLMDVIRAEKRATK